MPELPEVETVRRGLEPAMARARVVSVDLRRPDLRFPLPPRFAVRLKGARILALRRRAKYLLAELDRGETLVMHLGMSGRFTVFGSGAAAPDARPGDPAHDHVVFSLIDAAGAPARVVYNDPRRFGFMDLVATDALETSAHFAGMGPEPLTEAFGAATLDAAFRGKRAPVKAALLDQRVVAGLGNIYVCEALWRARVSPRRLADSAVGARAARIAAAVKAVLAEAIDAGGSTLRDYAGADGALGYFQHAFSVYGREGAACAACGAQVRRIVQSGRSTFYCGRCQR